MVYGLAILFCYLFSSTLDMTWLENILNMNEAGYIVIMFSGTMLYFHPLQSPF